MPKKSKWQEFKDLLDIGRWRSFMHWFKNLINFFDDGPDSIKHKIHGAKIFGVRIRIDKWMRGRGNPDK